MDKDRVKKLREQSGGPMTPEEIEFLRAIQEFVATSIANNLDFVLTIATLAHDVNSIAQLGGDVCEAKSQNVNFFVKDQKRTQDLCSRSSIRMTDDELEVLADMKAFIEFAISNGLGFLPVLGTLGHDVNGIIQHGGEMSEVKSQFFTPRVTGYSQYTPDDVGVPDESEGQGDSDRKPGRLQ